MQAGKQQEVFRERQALITMDHPNIVKMYWSFNVTNTYAFTQLYSRIRSIFTLCWTWPPMENSSASSNAKES